MENENKSGWDFKKKTLAAVLVGIAVLFVLLRFTALGSVVTAFWRVLRPVFYGLGLAFLLNPIMKLFERLLGKAFLRPNEIRSEKREMRLRRFVRILSVILAILVLLLLIAGFLLAVVPQFVEAARYLGENLYDKIVGVLDWADKVTGYRFADVMERSRTDGRIYDWIDTGERWIRNYFHLGQEDDVIATLTGMGRSVINTLVGAVVALFIAVYLLMDKERYKAYIKRLIHAVFQADDAALAMDVLRKADEIFYGFIIGKIKDSVVVGIICYFSMLLMGLPYALLCSFIVGVTNIIPVFGPYIGALPTVILLFVNEPSQGILFLIYVIILQQVDGNLIGPKILGDSTGISPLWVIVAILVGGGFFGFFGMLLSVPTVALLLYILDRLTERKAAEKGLPTRPEDYL